MAVIILYNCLCAKLAVSGARSDRYLHIPGLTRPRAHLAHRAPPSVLRTSTITVTCMSDLHAHHMLGLWRVASWQLGVDDL
jgi:hypothetical protein